MAVANNNGRSGGVPVRAPVKVKVTGPPKLALGVAPPKRFTPPKQAARQARAVTGRMLASTLQSARPTAKLKPVKSGGSGFLSTITPGAVVHALGGAEHAVSHAVGDVVGSGFGAIPLANAVTRLSGVGKAGPSVDKTLQNFGKDLVDIPANAVPSAYLLGKTAVTKGPAAAGKQLAQPFVQTVEHPLKSFQAHPLGTALMFSGAEGALGRGIGKALRTAPSSTLRELGSTERATATVPGTALRQERRYSKDVFVKAGQKAAESLGKAPARPVMSSHAIKRQVDELFDMNEDVRRAHRARAITQSQQALGKKPDAATTLVAQNIIQPTAQDLAAYKGEVAQAGGKLTEPVKVKANRETQKELARAKVTPETLPAAQRFAAISVPKQKALASIFGQQERFANARLIPGSAREGGKGGTAVPEPAFVSHAPNARGARNFYVGPAPQSLRISATPRTGTAVREGTLDVHPQAMLESHVRTQGLIDAAHGYSRFIFQFGRRNADGTVETHPDFLAADRAARNLTETTGMRWQAVPATPFNASKAQLDQALNEAGVGHMNKTLEDALSGANVEHKGRWLIVPEAAAQRAAEHVHTLGPGPLGRLGNLYGANWRKIVLALSPKWLTGNVAEAALRSAVAHAGPRSYITGRGVLKRVEDANPELGLQVRSRTAGGGHYGMQERAMVHTNAQQFAGTKLAPAATVAGKLRRAPVTKQMADGWGKYTDLVFKANSALERQFQTAQLGKAIRDHPLMSQHLVKLSKKAMDEAARGLTNTETQIQLGREVDRMYGRYSKYSPAEKRAVQTFVPFIRWSANALRFLGDVLPRDHPVLTGALASAAQATAGEREKHGLLYGGAGQVPMWLMGSIPLGKGDSAKVRASRYTPFGAMDNEGGILGTFAQNVLPQLSDVINASQGKDFTGKSIAGPHKTATVAQDLGAVLKSLGESVVPGAAQVDRILHDKGNAGQRLRKEFDPFMAVQKKQPKSSAPFDFKTAGSGLSTVDSGFDFKTAH